MPGITQRPYQSEADYAAMRGLLIAAGADPVLRAYCTVGDLDWWRSTHADPEHVRNVPLWFDGAELAGFLWPNDNNADMIVHPAHRNAEPAMVAWAEENLAGDDGEDGRKTVTTWALTQDATRVALLAEQGFCRTEKALIYHTVNLADSLEEPTVPAGYLLRGFAGERETEARVAVHRSAFHPSRMTVEKHRRVMASPTYRQELDLMALAPDGTPAAYCIVWYDAVNRFGVFEPVGTHQDYRRLGLAKAVLLHGQRLLRELGAEVAHVCAALGNEASTGLYPAAGFAVVDYICQWQKSILLDRSAL